jgi:arsenate reductase (thioredoxin)
MMTKQTVLFLCTGNSCRSQMAEALLRARAGDRFDVYSAGSEPKGIHPLTIRVLNEIGIDTSQLRSKDVKEFLGRVAIDQLIVVCENANGSCPRIFPDMQHRLFWPFDDPPAFPGTDEEKLVKFRQVRDQIDFTCYLHLNRHPRRGDLRVAKIIADGRCFVNS